MDCLTRFEPEFWGRIIFYRQPEDSLLTSLPDTTIRFIVRSRNQQGDEAKLQWFQGDSLLGRDTPLRYDCTTLGDYPIVCRVNSGDWQAETGWMVRIIDLFIYSHTPDTLNFALRRGSTVTFRYRQRRRHTRRCGQLRLDADGFGNSRAAGRGRGFERDD